MENVTKEIIPPVSDEEASSINVIMGLLSAPDPAAAFHYQQANTGTDQSGEKKLWFALFKTSIEDYQLWLNSDRSVAKIKRNFEEIFNWIFNPDPVEENWPGSFENVCANLKLHPDYVRKMLITWTKRNYGKSNNKHRQYRRI